MDNDSAQISSNPTADEESAVLRRRQLLRGSALLAGAGVAAVAVAVPAPAYGADGDAVKLGAENDSSSTTTIAIDGSDGGPSPTLYLRNESGPSLEMSVLAEDVNWGLGLGQLADTELGPIAGVTHPDFGLTTTYLATGIDLDDLPTPYALPKPIRLLDTRTSAGRASVLRASSGAYDSAYRLKPGAWLDIEVAGMDGFEMPAAWVNATVTSAQTNGFLSVYPPGDFPGTSTLNFSAKQTLANAAFVATGIVSGRFAIRVRTNAATHVVVDLTGVSIKGSGAPNSAGSARKNTSSQTPKSRATRAALTRRLRSTLTDRVRNSLSR